MLWTSLDVKMGGQLTVLTRFDKCHQIFDTCHWCWTVSVGLIWSEITAGHAPCGDSRACHSDRADHCQPAQKTYVGTYCTLPNYTLTTWRCPWRASRMRSKLPGCTSVDLLVAGKGGKHSGKQTGKHLRNLANKRCNKEMQDAERAWDVIRCRRCRRCSWTTKTVPRQQGKDITENNADQYKTQLGIRLLKPCSP